MRDCRKAPSSPQQLQAPDWIDAAVATCSTRMLVNINIKPCVCAMASFCLSKHAWATHGQLMSCAALTARQGEKRHGRTKHACEYMCLVRYTFLLAGSNNINVQQFTNMFLFTVTSMKQIAIFSNLLSHYHACMQYAFTSSLACTHWLMQAKKQIKCIGCHVERNTHHTFRQRKMHSPSLLWRAVLLLHGLKPLYTTHSFYASTLLFMARCLRKFCNAKKFQHGKWQMFENTPVQISCTHANITICHAGICS
jgi:hypothetical protein